MNITRFFAYPFIRKLEIFLAQKYNIASVFQVCTDLMQLDIDNVLYILAVVRFFGIEPLINRCWRFIDQNVYDLIESEEFLGIDQEMLGELLGRDRLMLYRKPWKGGEMALWRAALRWADEQCRQNGLEILRKNRRQMLGPALYKIRFSLIKQEDFKREIAFTGVLIGDEFRYMRYSDPEQAATHFKHTIILPSKTRA